MNNQEKLGIWKKKLIKLKENIPKLERDKKILINLLNEAKARQGIDLDNPLYEIELREKISYINDWIELHLNDVEKYENKLKELEGKDKDGLKREIKEEDIEDSFKFIFSEVKEEKSIAGIKALKVDVEKQPIERAKWTTKEKIINIRERIKEFKLQKSLVKYAIPLAVLLLIIISLVLLKPIITGFVIADEEVSYVDNINLIVNEDSDYIWELNTSIPLKSIKLSGSLENRGSAKVYVENNDVRYLVFDSNKLNEEAILDITGFVAQDDKDNVSFIIGV